MIYTQDFIALDEWFKADHYYLLDKPTARGEGVWIFDIKYTQLGDIQHNFQYNQRGEL
jgi:hypothetical protein